MTTAATHLGLHLTSVGSKHQNIKYFICLRRIKKINISDNILTAFSNNDLNDQPVLKKGVQFMILMKGVEIEMFVNCIEFLISNLKLRG